MSYDVVVRSRSAAKPRTSTPGIHPPRGFFRFRFFKSSPVLSVLTGFYHPCPQHPTAVSLEISCWSFCWCWCWCWVFWSLFGRTTRTRTKCRPRTTRTRRSRPRKRTRRRRSKRSRRRRSCLPSSATSRRDGYVENEERVCQACAPQVYVCRRPSSLPVCVHLYQYVRVGRSHEKYNRAAGMSQTALNYSPLGFCSVVSQGVSSELPCRLIAICSDAVGMVLTAESSQRVPQGEKKGLFFA